MPIPTDLDLYEESTKLIKSKYKKNSAYASGAIIKDYKKKFLKKYGENKEPYIEDNEPKNLERWFNEKWSDIGQENYPVYRPSIKINKNTPLTVNEIDPKNLKKQIKLKQKIKGTENLPKFEKKGGNITVYFN